jgi:hypothetical protein
MFLLVLIVLKTPINYHCDHKQGTNNPILPYIGCRKAIAKAQANQKHENIIPLHFNLEIARLIYLHFVVAIEVSFVDPKQDEYDDDEQGQKVWYLEDVEGIEGPDIEDYHQFELNGEGRPPDFSMQPHLAKLSPASPCLHDIVSFPIVESVPDVDKGNDDRNDQEGENVGEKLFELGVFGELITSEIDYIVDPWCNDVKEEMEGNSGDDNKI